MAYGELNAHVSEQRRHVTLKGQCRDPNTLRAEYLENSWRCYLLNSISSCFRESFYDDFAVLYWRLASYVVYLFALRKTEPYGTETAFYPRNWTETDRTRPARETV